MATALKELNASPVQTMPNSEDEARTVIMLPELYRAALRSEAQDRGIDMGDIVAELIEGNASLMTAVDRIKKRRETEAKKKSGK
jgi:hypothetical protein